MSALDWIQSTDRMVGKGHPTQSDTLNAALRQLLSESGYDPDATTFPGLPGPVANVLAYGAVLTGADSTTGINAALASGKPVFFPDGVYYANNLTQSTTGQRIFASGNVQIIKNANGPLLTCSGNQVLIEGIQFRGDASTPVYTGDNVVFSGDNCSMVNCGSRYAYGRAVKATGGHFVIHGSQRDIYQTADATGTGYDIELGVSGTATLYHQLLNIYSSQATGGILLTDTGSAIIIGGQFGKLNIAAGTSPAGSNGGSIIGSRILGAVTVGLSNCEFSGCAFGAVAITINASISGVLLGPSNGFQVGHTIVNNGNASNYIHRSVGTGSYIEDKWGHDTSTNIVRHYVDTTGRQRQSGPLVIPNNQSYIMEQAAGTDGGNMNMSSADNLQITNTVSGKDIIKTVTGTGKHSFDVAGGSRRAAQFDDDATANNTKFLLYDVTAGALVRVSRGAADSGGAGFRVLRVPN